MLVGHKEELQFTGVARKILRLLDPLKHSESGAAIYSYIEDTIRSNEYHFQQTETAYADLLTLLLNTLARQLPAGSPLQVELKLMEVRLTPPLVAADLNQLQEFLVQHADEMVRSTRGDGIVEDALAPLLTSFNIREKPAAPPPAAAEPPPPPPPAAAAEPPHALPDRQHLDEKRQSIQQIQQALAEQVNECLKHNEELGALLKREIQSLQTMPLADLQHAKTLLLAEAEQLLTVHDALTAKLEKTRDHLHVVETDSRQLSEELTRIHLLSLTDDLTGLPNRRAFLRRLQDEVGRVQRYGNPLSLALMDLDGFKAINDKMGHAAGDEVLRVFAGEILSIFRHHDLVARYGGEEFAVLLPNTHVEGALRALRKVQKRAQESSFQYNGSTLPLPTFSAGLALYRPGETTEALIQRADQAMYRAKHLGRNHIESDGDHTTPGTAIG